jgi:hypothetical protein
MLHRAVSHYSNIYLILIQLFAPRVGLALESSYFRLQGPDSDLYLISNTES